MKRWWWLIGILLLVFVLLGLYWWSIQPQGQELHVEASPMTQLANPASENCLQQGGELEMVTQSNGSQLGLCQFKDYLCEEWALYRGECNLSEDALAVETALKAKGLKLEGMKVVINKHFGKYLEGGVVPVDQGAGGGYVYAVKEGNVVKILADGNGTISCSAFTDYPDFPTYLVPECWDEVSGKSVIR